ncbi:MAG: hypothetical protein AAF573_14225, partial [Bacteroidota bacterium]
TYQKMRILLIFCLLFFTQNLLAQSDYVLVEDLLIEGNKKTKDRTVLRELAFAVGDSVSLSELMLRIKQSELLILNTGLFTKAKINIRDWDTANQRITISVALREMWYFYPMYVFELADRNFNVWWEEQGRSLDRVNYGGRFSHINLTGRRDYLKTIVQFGYTKKFEVVYSLPMIGKSRNLGGFAEVHFSNRREIAYITEESKLLFKRQVDESVLQRRFRAGGGITYRPGLNTYHTGKILYINNWIGDTISQILNPDYFLDSRNKQRHFTLQYRFVLDRRDVRAYPQAGNLFSLLFQKDGLGTYDDINVFSASSSYAHYFPLGKKLSFGAKVKGRYTFNRSEQPYTHVAGLGYFPNFIRGYELYVMDGLDYAYAKTHFQFRLFKKEINWGRYMPVPQFRLMPVKVYLAINNDFGYANAPYNALSSTLSNEWLWGRGVGLDVVVFQDKVWQFEYSFNHLGEHGFFLHFELRF